MPFQEAAQFLPKGCSMKMPLHFLNSNGVVCSNTLFLTSSLLFRGNSTCKILEHLVWSNTSGFQFWGPLAQTNFLSALCGLPTFASSSLEASQWASTKKGLKVGGVGAGVGTAKGTCKLLL